MKKKELENELKELKRTLDWYKKKCRKLEITLNEFTIELPNEDRILRKAKSRE